MVFIAHEDFEGYPISFKAESQKSESRVCFKDKCFVVEVAKSVEEHARGLMYRESLAENSGMLFVFEKEGIYPFWMKNTLIPLDMIWLSKDGETVFIKENTEPCKTAICPSINPQKEALYVLELSAGVVDKLGLKIGDKITIDI